MGAPHHATRKKVTTVIAAELTTTRAAAEAAGVSMQTVRRWRDDPALLPYVQKTRDEMAEEMRGLAVMALEQIRRRLPDFEPRDLNTLLGIATEKALLLAGDATSRTESRDITGTLTDADLIAAIRDAEALLAGAPQKAEGSTAD